jgi:hypothetical protein
MSSPFLSRQRSGNSNLIRATRLGEFLLYKQPKKFGILLSRNKLCINFDPNGFGQHFFPIFSPPHLVTLDLSCNFGGRESLHGDKESSPLREMVAGGRAARFF